RPLWRGFNFGSFAGIPAGRLPLGVRFCRWSLRMNSPHLVPGTEGGLPALQRIGAGALAAWGGPTSIGATSRSAWIWQTPSRTRNRGRRCCKWRRYGCAWHSSTMPSKDLIISPTAEGLLARPPWRASPRLAPFPPKPGGAARSWPLAPDGGIPPRIACIPLMFPCRDNRALDPPVPNAWRAMRKGTICATAGGHAYKAGSAYGSLGALAQRTLTGQNKTPPSGRGGVLGPANAARGLIQQPPLSSVHRMDDELWLGRKDPIGVLPDHGVTFARNVLEGRAVEDLDVAAPVSNQAGALQQTGGDRDGGAPHAEHLPEKLLRQRDDIAVDAIMNGRAFLAEASMIFPAHVPPPPRARATRRLV